MTAPAARMPTALELHRLALQHARRVIDQARIPVFDERPDATSRDRGYAVLSPDMGVERVTRGHGRTTSWSGRFYAACFGGSRAQATLVADELTAAFRDWKPWPDWPRFGAVEREDADPIGLDKSVPTDHRWLFLLSFRLTDDD